MASRVNPELPAAVKARFPASQLTTTDKDAMRALAARVEALAGGDLDGLTFTAGVAQALRWLADGTTASEFLSVVISATDAES